MTRKVCLFLLYHVITFEWLEFHAVMLVAGYITVIVIYIGCHMFMDFLWCLVFVCCVVKLLGFCTGWKIWTLAWDPYLQQAQITYFY